MRTFLFLIAIVTLAGCYASRKEIQVEMISAELIRIDTVHRYSTVENKQVLTWRDDENIEYISYAPMQTVYLVGTRMSVLKTR
jgi:hypothetical protein